MCDFNRQTIQTSTAPSRKPHAGRVKWFKFGVVSAAAVCRGGLHQGTLAHRGAVGHLPVSQAYHATGLRGAVASDRRRITWARRSEKKNRQRACAFWSSEALPYVDMTGLTAVPWHDFGLKLQPTGHVDQIPQWSRVAPENWGPIDAASIVDRRSAPRSANFCGGPLDGCCNADYTVLDGIDHAVTRPARALTVQHCPLPRCLQRIDRPTASSARWSSFARAESFIGIRRRHIWVGTSMQLGASRQSSNPGEHVSGGDKCAYSYTRR